MTLIRSLAGLITLCMTAPRTHGPATRTWFIPVELSVWSHAKGARLKDRKKLFDSSLEGKVRREAAGVNSHG